MSKCPLPNTDCYIIQVNEKFFELKRDVGIVEKAGKQDWKLGADSCVHVSCHAFMNNEWYLRTCYEMQETNPHHLVCSHCSYTRANNLIPISILIHIYHRSCSVMYACVVCTRFNFYTKVIDMPVLNLQSCLDQDVMTVTVKYIDRMFNIS